MFDTKLKPEEIATKSLEIASELCIYTNNNILIEKDKMTSFTPREIVSELDRFI